MRFVVLSCATVLLVTCCSVVMLLACCSVLTWISVVWVLCVVALGLSGVVAVTLLSVVKVVVGLLWVSV